MACLLLVYHWASYSSFWSFSLGQDLKRRKPWWAPDNVTMSQFLMDSEILLITHGKQTNCSYVPHVSWLNALNVNTFEDLGSFMSRYCRQQILWYLLLYLAKNTLRAHCHGFYEPFLGETRPSALGMLDLIYGPCKPVDLFTTNAKNIFSAEKIRKYLMKGIFLPHRKSRRKLFREGKRLLAEKKEPNSDLQ